MMSMGLRPWMVVAGLSLGPAVSNGLARFAYGLILPAMQADLSWNFTGAGRLNTANVAGHLTFLVALMQEGAASAEFIAICWTLLGVGAIAAPFVWRSVLTRSAGGGALALACLATGAAALLLVGLPGSVPALVVSVVVFGLSFFIAPTAVTSFARKNLDQAAWARAVGMFTIVFALGQIVGPILAGFVSDITGSVSLGMAAAGVLLILGAASAALSVH